MCNRVLVSNDVAGHRQIFDMSNFLSSILPAEGGITPFEQPYNHGSSLLVLCRPDFALGSSFSDCQHWLPAWLEADVPEAELVMQKWLEHVSAKDSGAISNLEAMLECSKDELVRASIRLEVDRLETRMLHRPELIRSLLQQEGILCGDVISDGNCGVEAILRLELARQIGAGNLPLDLPNLGDQIAQARRDIQGLWMSVSNHPKWQTLWRHLCGGHVDLKAWKQEEKTFSTPKKRKQTDTPFTPENPSQKKKKGVVPVRSPVPDAIEIPGVKDAEVEPVKKKSRRTGKALPIATKINFDKYFDSALAKHGVTYRQWMKSHSETTVIVPLGSIYTYFNAFSCLIFFIPPELPK